ncbi:tetratricopeptide repeat protein [Streptomyces sp. NPDC048508]|uniref:tetratricopeptide repeat protein n=1 Tax=Streptomyces sp. NPDC048508 TaxID=3365561 RepID=UPI00371339EC
MDGKWEREIVAARYDISVGKTESAVRSLRSLIKSDFARNYPRRRLTAQVALATAWRVQGDYRRAGLLFYLSLPSVENSFGPDSLAVAGLCNEWAVWGKYTGNFDLAEELYRRSLGILEDKYGPHHNGIATICHNLGGLAHARGDFSSGESWARRSVEVRRLVHGPDHIDVVADEAAWSTLLQECGRLQEAELLLWHALKVYEKLDNIYELAIVWHNLAALSHRRGSLKMAEHRYRRALSLKAQVLGVKHPECAITIINLAGVHRVQGHTVTAAIEYERALTLLRPIVSAGHPHVRAAERGLAAVREADSRKRR